MKNGVRIRALALAATAVAASLNGLAVATPAQAAACAGSRADYGYTYDPATASNASQRVAYGVQGNFRVRNSATPCTGASSMGGTYLALRSSANASFMRIGYYSGNADTNKLFVEFQLCVTGGTCYPNLSSIPGSAGFDGALVPARIEYNSSRQVSEFYYNGSLRNDTGNSSGPSDPTTVYGTPTAKTQAYGYGTRTTTSVPGLSSAEASMTNQSYQWATSTSYVVPSGTLPPATSSGTVPTAWQRNRYSFGDQSIWYVP